MELYPVEMVGIAIFSLLFFVYLILSKQKDYTLRFLSAYCCIYFAITAVLQNIFKDPSLFLTLTKCGFPLLFVAFYPLLSRHNMSKKEVSLLIFVSAIGIIPFLMDWFTILAFAFNGNNM